MSGVAGVEEWNRERGCLRHVMALHVVNHVEMQKGEQTLCIYYVYTQEGVD